MKLEGDLKTHSLPDVLQRISRAKQTGILTVQGEQDIIAISFLKGRIVAADALSDTMEEGLGKVLTKQALVSQEEFSAVVTEQQTLGGHLPELLVERKLVTREQLLESMRLKIYQLLLSLLRWKDGVFKLFVGNEVSYELGIKSISVEELLIRAMSDSTAKANLGFGGLVPDLDTIYEKRSDPRTIKILGRDGDQAVESSGSVWLTPLEKALLDRLDGEAPASTLAPGLGTDRYGVLYGLHRLLEQQLIRRRRKASEPMLATPPAVVSEPTSGPSPEPPPISLDLPEELQEPVSAQAVSVPVPSQPRDLQIEPSLPPEPTPKAEPRPAPAPKPSLGPAPTPKPRDDRSLGQVLSRFAIQVMSLAALTSLITVGFSGSSYNTLRHPFQTTAVKAFYEDQLESLYRKINRGARTYYLLYGQPPETLTALVELHLLSAEDLEDGLGRGVSYIPGETGYTVRVIDKGNVVVEAEQVIDLAENFLLNPTLSELSRQRPAKPLVLLD